MTSKHSSKWEKFQKTPLIKLYNDTQIPAKLFFEILESNDLTRLIIKGEPSEEELTVAWDDIFDEYFKAREDGKLKLIMKTRGQIALLSHKVTIIHTAIRFITFHPLSKDQRLEVIEKLKSIGININVNAPVMEEILKVLQSKIPALETRLRLEKHNLDQLKKGKVATFEKALVSLETVFGYSLIDELTLAKYLAYEEKAIQISNERRKQTNKNRRKRK